MSSLTTQDGKLVVRDGKLGTEQACCCGGGGENAQGRCCHCDIGLEIFDLVNNLTGVEGGEITPQDVLDRVAASAAAGEAIVQLLQDNGWECASYEPATFEIYNNIDGERVPDCWLEEYGEGSSQPLQDCPEGQVCCYGTCQEPPCGEPPDDWKEFYRIASKGYVFARCCGTVDSSTPIAIDDVDGYTPVVDLYLGADPGFLIGAVCPCVGPYAYNACTGDDTQAACDAKCGEFAANTGCDDEPACAELEYEPENPLP